MIGEKLYGFRYREAIIGFGGTPTFWWMRFLKKGFYHCVVALGAGHQWILIDPLLHYTDAVVIENGNVERYLRKQGYQTLHVTIQEPAKRCLQLMPYTCVETAKRFIGLQNRWIWTPYQLYRKILSINRKKILDIGKKV